jgi:hypothetical protein
MILHPTLGKFLFLKFKNQLILALSSAKNQNL